MTEPDVTLSDYALVAECVTLAWLMARRPGPRNPVRAWTIAFFAATGTAALLGGTVHGFFVEQTTLAGRLLWKGSLLAIGAAALAAGAMASLMVLSSERAYKVVSAAAALAVAYSAVILFVADAFWIAIVGYLPAAVFLLYAFDRVRASGKSSDAAYGTVGVILTFIAAAIQQLRIGLHPSYFNHNALYHSVQAIALLLIFVACRNLVFLSGDSHAHTT